MNDNPEKIKIDTGKVKESEDEKIREGVQEKEIGAEKISEEEIKNQKAEDEKKLKKEREKIDGMPIEGKEEEEDATGLISVEKSIDRIERSAVFLSKKEYQEKLAELMNEKIKALRKITQECEKYLNELEEKIGFWGSVDIESLMKGVNGSNYSLDYAEDVINGDNLQEVQKRIGASEKEIDRIIVTLAVLPKITEKTSKEFPPFPLTIRPMIMADYKGDYLNMQQWTKMMAESKDYKVRKEKKTGEGKEKGKERVNKGKVIPETTTDKRKEIFKEVEEIKEKLDDLEKEYLKRQEEIKNIGLFGGLIGRRKKKLERGLHVLEMKIKENEEYYNSKIRELRE